MTAANLPREARALLDAIAQGESDPSAESEGISPYFILYGGGSFEALPNRDGYNGFPAWQGRDNSHAAGRYQFEPATWKGIVPRFAPGVPDFRNPGDQDWGAWMLAQQDYHARTGGNLLNALQFGDTGDIGGVLRPTWTSMSDNTFLDRYTEALAAYPATTMQAPAPAPLPVPLVPPTRSPPPPPGRISPEQLQLILAALQAQGWTPAAPPPDPVKAAQYAGLVRVLLPAIGGLMGIIGIAAPSFTDAQITAYVQLAMTVGGMLIAGYWSWQQKKQARAKEVASAVASAQAGAPVTVTVTPATQPNIVTPITRAELAAAPSVP